MVKVDRDEIIHQEYIINNKTRKEVAKILGIQESGLIAYLYRHKIKKPSGKDTYRNKEWLFQKYIIENLTSEEIVSICEATSRSIICNWLKIHNISIKPCNQRQKFRRKYTKDELQEYKHYRSHVRRLSDRNYHTYKDMIDPDGLGRNRLYHLDHLYPIAKGFEHNINPKIISSPINLRIIRGTDNRKKYTIEEITIENLYYRYNKFK